MLNEDNMREEQKRQAKRMAYWAGLFVFSMVVMNVWSYVANRSGPPPPPTPPLSTGARVLISAIVLAIGAIIVIRGEGPARRQLVEFGYEEPQIRRLLIRLRVGFGLAAIVGVAWSWFTL